MKKLIPTVVVLLLLWQTSCGEWVSLPRESAVSSVVPVVQTATPSPFLIGNKNTRKFHLSSCYSLPMEKNRVYFSSKEEAEEAYYQPCMNCNP